MNIIGQAQTNIGERKRHRIPGWSQIKGVWKKNRERTAKELESKMPLAAGADFTAETSLAIAQRNFMNAASTELGVADLPTSISFPDGRVHSGMDKL